MLHGVRVVDCSTGIAGAYCSKLLADAGADVVKVEPPSGDPLRSSRSGALFEFLATSKRSITATLADDEIRALCATADIVIESEQPGIVDVSALRAANPTLVVVSITPYGQDGPWAGRVGTEFTLQGWCGSTGNRGEPERPPVAAGGQIGEWMSGTYAAVAAVAAATEATRSGKGEHIDVAWLDCMALTMNTYTSVFADFLDWPPLRRPTRSFEIPSIEPTADGYAAFTTNSRQQWSDFLLLIGRPELDADEELASAIGRFKRRVEALEILRAWTTQQTTATALDEATLLRIPNGPVGNGATVTAFDHFEERGTFVASPTGRFVQPRVPYAISGLTPRPFDALSTVEGTAALDWKVRTVDPIVLESVANRNGRPGSPQRDALPLDGLRVLDCTAWWAGPAATHMLACLGADVIKVESVTRPDLMRYTSVKPPTTEQWWEWGPLFHGNNTTKRGITIDLTTEEGRDLFTRLLPTADVLVENFSPRVMEQFGFGWEQVHAANPNLVMVRMPAYGLDGPWRDRTGFAQTMEAITGMAWVTGWPDGPPLIPRGACDPLAAMHAVFATLLALRDRASTGDGHLVEMTMIEAALNCAAEQVVEHSATGTLLARDGNRGPHAAPQNVYQCSGDEEWIALAVADDEQWRSLCKVLGNPTWAADPTYATMDGRRAGHDAIDAELAAWCADQDARDLAERLMVAGVPAAHVVDARDIASNPQLQHRGYFEVEDHPVTGKHPIPMVPFRFRDRDANQATRRWMRRASPTVGEHNEEVLAELGLSADELDDLRARGLIGNRPVGAS